MLKGVSAFPLICTFNNAHSNNVELGFTVELVKCSV